jgi:hypothetical protein
MKMIFNNDPGSRSQLTDHELDLPPPIRDRGREVSRYAMDTLVKLPEGRSRLRHLEAPNINRTFEENEQLRAAVAARILYLAEKNLAKGNNSYEALIKALERETDWEPTDIESAVGFAELYGLRVNRLKMTVSAEPRP